MIYTKNNVTKIAKHVTSAKKYETRFCLTHKGISEIRPRNEQTLTTCNRDIANKGKLVRPTDTPAGD